MPIQQRSQLKGFGQSTNEKYLVLDVNDLNTSKQDTLVSGTDIKTINGTSVLGSGNLSIGAGIHALVKPVTGRRIVYNIIASGMNGSNFIANRLVLMPFMPANTFTISEISMNVNSAIAGSLCRLLIYSDNNGVPNAKLYESANLDCSTTGLKSALTTFTFVAGTTYWLAFHGGTTVSNIVQIQPVGLYSIANNPGASADTATQMFITATLGSAPEIITSPSSRFSESPWIVLTPA
jgi:hypothetical protein